MIRDNAILVCHDAGGAELLSLFEIITVSNPSDKLVNFSKIASNLTSTLSPDLFITWSPIFNNLCTCLIAQCLFGDADGIRTIR